MDVRQARGDEIHFVNAESGDLELIRTYTVCTSASDFSCKNASREAISNFSIATSYLVLLLPFLYTIELLNLICRLLCLVPGCAH